MRYLLLLLLFTSCGQDYSLDAICFSYKDDFTEEVFLNVEAFTEIEPEITLKNKNLTLKFISQGDYYISSMGGKKDTIKYLKSIDTEVNVTTMSNKNFTWYLYDTQWILEGDGGVYQVFYNQEAYEKKLKKNLYESQVQGRRNN